MFIQLTQEQKDQLGINPGNEVFIVKCESDDFCGIWENYAIQLPATDDDNVVLDGMSDYMSDIEAQMASNYIGDGEEEDLDGEEPTWGWSVEEGADWRFEWLLPNAHSCQPVNF